VRQSVRDPGPRAGSGSPLPSLPGSAPEVRPDHGRTLTGGSREATARVLIAAPQPFYEDRGTPIAVRQLAEALVRLGYGVDILTYPVGRSLEDPAIAVHRARNPLGIRSVPIGFSGRKLALDATLVPELYVRMRSGEFHVVHAVEEAAFPAVWLGRRYGIPVIYDMQSSLPEQLIKHSLLRSRPLQFLLHGMERWLVKHSAAVVTSTGLAEHVRRISPSTCVSEWRYASPMTVAPQHEAMQLRASLAIAPDAPVILYSGTFESYQGLDALIRAVPQVRETIPDAVFVLVGADSRNPVPLASECSSLINAGAMRMIERRPREEMPRYLAMADVLVSPRVHGGNLPLKIFDYMAAGKPIVATDIPTHRTVLTAERAELVAPDAKAVAQGLIGVLGDPARASRMAAAAAAYAEAHLGWLGFVESVGQLYDDVLACSR
jgi:glycosyltransferase involved in cell wall biosynthesis